MASSTRPFSSVTRRENELAEMCSEILRLAAMLERGLSEKVLL